MKRLVSHSTSPRALVLAVAMAATFALVAPGLAGAAKPPAGSTVDVVHIKEVKGALLFVAPETVHQGDWLEVVNDTNPKKIGPHTFSLVTKESLPKTKKARQTCFTPNHICRAIADWHGVKGEGPVKINPAEAGAEGWDTMGSTSVEGDSWFVAKKGGSLAQEVTVDTTAGPQTIHFMCAIHPWMQGKTTVLPAGS